MIGAIVYTWRFEEIVRASGYLNVVSMDLPPVALIHDGASNERVVTDGMPAYYISLEGLAHRDGERARQVLERLYALGDWAAGEVVERERREEERRSSGYYQLKPRLTVPQMFVRRFVRKNPGSSAEHISSGLQDHARAGGTVAASCSAVFLLQSADLLAGRRVTTSWWLAPLLQQIESRVVVDADRIVIRDGTVVTAGAAFAQTDLMLHLLSTQFSPALANEVSRVLLIDGRQSQAEFIVPAMLSNGNEFIAKLVARFESALPNPPSISGLAAEFCMSDRTLSRHVRVATGRSTSALLQSVRLNKARMLLETSKLTVEQVAERVGYVDTTALRRLMRKVMGATPRQFRPAVSDPSG